MSNPNNPQRSAPPPHESVKLKKPGTGLMIFGGLLIVVALILGVVGFVGGLTFAIPKSDEVQRIDGSLKVQLAAGEKRTVWRPEGSNVQCRALDAAGEVVEFEGLASTNFENDKGAFVSIGNISGEGEFTIECTNGVGAISPPLGLLALFGGLGAFFLGMFIGFAGGTLFLVGLIISLVRK